MGSFWLEVFQKLAYCQKIRFILFMCGFFFWKHFRQLRYPISDSHSRIRFVFKDWLVYLWSSK
jgi:hypothetical protein